MENAQETFREEARELLDELNEVLLEMESRPEDLGVVGRAFRALHTIKGSGSMFGFDALAAFVHDIETVFDFLREGRLAISRELIDLTLAACDIIRTMVDGTPDADQQSRQQQVSDAFSRIAAGCTTAVPHEADAATLDDRERVDAEGAQLATWRILFRPEETIFMSGTDPLLLLDELRSLGTAHVTAVLDHLPGLPEMAADHCYVDWVVLLTTTRGLNAIKDVFIFVEDDCTLDIQRVEVPAEVDPATDLPRIGEILLQHGAVTPEALASALASQKRIGEVLVTSGTASSSAVESALAEQEHVRQTRAASEAASAASSVRVASDKIDTLVNLVGEMVTVQARLSQTAALSDSPELHLIAEEVERLTAELRDNAMEIRMVPIGSTFGKYRRVVRDLARDLGKEVHLEMRGGDTELDKTVIERLGDPLMHILRNSIDHGIESPEAREQAGKPRSGTVTMTARHSGARVLIEISDDGAGMDRDAILAKAREKGLVADRQELTDSEVYELVFAPGFSTAVTVTNVSGRGVGMDVVRQNITSLRGTISIASTPGAGSAITLAIPLTLAIIEGLLVEIADSRYVLPLAVVEECVELTRLDIEAMHGKHTASVRGELVPYLPLRAEFGLAGERPAIEQIIICHLDDTHVGFVVDRVIGSYQTVIKNLGTVYRDIEGFSGATILGDGQVALIIDPVRLLATRRPEVDR